MRPGWAGRRGVAGAMIVTALGLTGCQSKARQDAYHQLGSTCFFLAPTVSGTRTYSPGKVHVDAPDSAIAYPDPETPIYCDRPLSESLRSAIELANYARALQTVGLFDQLQQNGPFTVFAIPNEPLKELSDRYPAGLLAPENAALLRSVLGYTIVQGKWTPERLKATIAHAPTHAAGLVTVSGGVLTVSQDPGTGELALSNGSGAVNKLWVSGIPQSNGVLYFTRSLLLPAGMANAAPLSQVRNTAAIDAPSQGRHPVVR